MSILTALYNLIIGPLELFFEVIFSLAHSMTGNPGLSIILLSLVMNFLVLPLYRQADAMQAREREIEAKLNPWVTHIKKTFKGDERFMMLQTYYRQNHYKPTYALRGSMSLLLEIPFFMAAYNLLSGLQLLKGVSFGPIRDLGAPDSMLVIAGITIHVLPILMTAINMISAMIYSKGFPLKSKIQMYGMALIFLVFLYQSPAGLVFYWTLNNVFSLAKNIFARLKNPKLAVCILSSVVSVVLLPIVLFVSPMPTRDGQTAAIVLLAALQLPIVFYFVKKLIKTREVQEITKRDNMIYYAGSIFITLLTGVLIPSTVIKTSPAEFINVVTLNNPLLYVLNAFLLAAGTFILWFGIFYMLASPAGKRKMGFVMWAFSGTAVVNYLFFGKKYGNLSPQLQFDVFPAFPVMPQIINALVVAAVIAVFYIVWKKKSELVNVVYLAAGLATVGMSVANMTGIQKVVTATMSGIQSTHQQQATIPLNKNGKNVVVIMMDRAISSYIPYMFQEKPELKEQFAGFTYYPNTISYGAFTNIGSPALYGGYEYTPVEINKRDEESLASKQNEALKVMPVLFNQQGYEVTVCDPTYAGYGWIPDLSIYDEYPEIRKFITMGKFNITDEDANILREHSMNRNFFCYSIFKTAPVVLQPVLYGQGLYNEADALYTMGTESEGLWQIQNSLSTAVGMHHTFMKSYAVLKNLPNITEISDKQQNTFMMISNDATHEPMLLQTPGYVPAPVVDNTAYDAAHTDRFILDGREMHMDTTRQMTHYHANMGSMIQLGKWLDHLRASGVYDNTRIIIVSDHGRNLRQFDDMIFGDEAHQDVMFYNPLLLVKDFGSTEFTTDNTFMTNADVPTLATGGLIENPVNPFTGKPINWDPKLESEQHILYSDKWDTAVNNGNTYLPGKWLSVWGNIFDLNNWKELN